MCVCSLWSSWDLSLIREVPCPLPTSYPVLRLELSSFRGWATHWVSDPLVHTYNTPAQTYVHMLLAFKVLGIWWFGDIELTHVICLQDYSTTSSLLASKASPSSRLNVRKLPHAAYVILHIMCLLISLTQMHFIPLVYSYSKIFNCSDLFHLQYWDQLPVQRAVRRLQQPAVGGLG